MDFLGEERGQYVRVGASVCAWLTFWGDRAAYSTLTVDLGPEGARFNTLRKVNVGERLHVQIELPQASIECKAEVASCDADTTQAGTFDVHFLDLASMHQDALNRFVKEHSTPSQAEAAVSSMSVVR